MALLKQVKGVGTLIALTYLLTLEDPHRFARAATWAVMWVCSRGGGTRGRANRSCTSARKAIPICERCWVQGAHHILGRFGADSDLRRWGLKLAEAEERMERNER